MIESPRVANGLVVVVVCLSLMLITIVSYRAVYKDPRSTQVHPCAMVLTRDSGPECR